MNKIYYCDIKNYKKLQKYLLNKYKDFYWASSTQRDILILKHIKKFDKFAMRVSFKEKCFYYESLEYYKNWKAFWKKITKFYDFDHILRINKFKKLIK